MPEAAGSLEDLLSTATSREVWQPADTKSGARFERLIIGGAPYVLKYQDPRDDWLLRATGDPGKRYVLLWERGLLDRLPDVIDHAVIGAHWDGSVGRVLLRDVSAALFPRNRRFSHDQHFRFLDHMAAFHAAFWGWRDDVGLTPLDVRYLMFSPATSEAEAALGSEAVVPKVMAQGWARLANVSPRLHEVVMPLLKDPAPLVAALKRLPHTFVHGDWKAANLGSHADGRTVLLDFGEVPGEASPLADLAWYVALNADLLPETKGETISAYRAALERHGVDTGVWWDAAVGLELLGAMLQFGWEKVLGGVGPELAWWEEHAVKGTTWL
jgi:hypothetical protein